MECNCTWKVLGWNWHTPDCAVWLTDRAYDGPMGIFEGYGEDEGCEGCNYTPCICHVPQSERWEGR